MTKLTDNSRMACNLGINSPNTGHQIQLLAAMFSPAFPIGAFSYSHGMEIAINAGVIRDFESTCDWIETCLIGGSGRNDAILMANSHKAVPTDLKNVKCEKVEPNTKVTEINELAFALSAGAERAQESRELGANFTRIVKEIYHVDMELLLPVAYPVSLGIATQRLGCELSLSVTFFLQSFVTNLISVAVRTVPLGQSDGQIMLAQLMPVITAVAKEATMAPLDDIGGYALLADHAAILHETLEPRIYRT